MLLSALVFLCWFVGISIHIHLHSICSPWTLDRHFISSISADTMYQFLLMFQKNEAICLWLNLTDILTHLLIQKQVCHTQVLYMSYGTSVSWHFSDHALKYHKTCILFLTFVIFQNMFPYYCNQPDCDICTSIYVILFKYNSSITYTHIKHIYDIKHPEMSKILFMYLIAYKLFVFYS